MQNMIQNAGLVGVIVFIRPLMGTAASVLMARLSNGTCGNCIPYVPRRLAQAGAIMAVPSYVIYICMYYETEEWQLLPSLLVALVIQGFSIFTTSLNCNTMVRSPHSCSGGLPHSRRTYCWLRCWLAAHMRGHVQVVMAVAEGDLANTQAVWRMMQTVFTTLATAVMLAVAAVGGSMSNPASYQPVWFLMVAEQLVVTALLLSLPKPRAEGGGFSRVHDSDTADGPAAKSIYSQK
eukprot:SAG31_NODE_11058_length_1070_cov_1.465499_1_plen_235_part_00